MIAKNPDSKSATTAEPMLVFINLQTMDVYTDAGGDVCLRALALHESDPHNAVYIDGKLYSVSNFELYIEVLSFEATLIDGGSHNG